MTALRLPAALDSLDELARYVLAFAVRAGLPPEAAYRLRLAVDELATNAVLHGYRGRDGELRITTGMDAQTAWIRLEDDAPPFDPGAARPDPHIGLPLAQRPIGGLGIHLALIALDDYQHTRTDGHNTSLLVIRRDHQADPTE
ncbi:ATP-binding protein [Kitasatospora sp. NPDC048722]|uniref:ATP-binding protein n=1 Tax=Kitasatospora sp. NPDC048722 TaxID=3155639 RepID=UPI0033F83348